MAIPPKIVNLGLPVNDQKTPNLTPTERHKLKLYSWNLNGIRACMKEDNFGNFIKGQKPDIACFQESRALPEQVDLTGFKKHQQIWNPAEKKGYSGTTTFSKTEPLSISTGIGHTLLDNEGRVQNLEYENFYLVNVYTPNSQRELTRLGLRQQWDAMFLKHLKKLEKNKPVITCGDFNVAHTEIDLANPKTNRKNAGFTEEERGGFDAFVKAGFVDTFREFNEGSGHYSWWSFRTNARERNIGWRIDYFLISKSLRPCLKSAKIHPKIFGSDHCPVSIELDDDLLG